jgi:hypothetical protein
MLTVPSSWPGAPAPGCLRGVPRPAGRGLAALHIASPHGDGRRCGARTPGEIAADVSYLSVQIPGELWAELNRVRQR